MIIKNQKGFEESFKSLQPIPIKDIGICDGPGGAVVGSSPLSPGVAEIWR
jgi:hypothetical protein